MCKLGQADPETVQIDLGEIDADSIGPDRQKNQSTMPGRPPTNGSVAGIAVLRDRFVRHVRGFFSRYPSSEAPMPPRPVESAGSSGASPGRSQCNGPA